MKIKEVVKPQALPYKQAFRSEHVPHTRMCKCGIAPPTIIVSVICLLLVQLASIYKM